MNQNIKNHHTIGSTGILIDGFRFATPDTKAYFLTHFHSDHYGGLDSEFPWENRCAAKLYCTPITAGLVDHCLEVKGRHIVAIPFNTPTNVLDFTVTFMPANHCPGAAIILFELADGRKVLHTGDMRFSPNMLDNPHLIRAAGLSSPEERETLSSPDRSVSGKKRAREGVRRTAFIDELYLDTTYSHPKHTFPPQSECIQAAVDVVRGYMPPGSSFAEPLATATTSNSGLTSPSLDGCVRLPEKLTYAPLQRTNRTLVLISTYVIGKERILVELARQLGLKVYVSLRKFLIAQHLGLSDKDVSYFTSLRADADIHVVGMRMCGKTYPYFQPNFDGMMRYMKAVNSFLKSQAAARAAAEGSSATPAIAGDATKAPDTKNEDEEEDAFVSQQSNVENDATATEDLYTDVVGIVPTGWVHSNKKKVFEKEHAHVYLTPYSEHSAFNELVEFVKFIRPRRVIPTVFENESDQAKIEARFSHLIDQNEAKRAFFGLFKIGSAPAPPSPGTSAAPAPPCALALTDEACCAPESDGSVIEILDDD